MQPLFLPALDDIQAFFDNEVSKMGGTVKETVIHDNSFFGKATFPVEGEVKPKDAIRKGVAIRVFEREIAVHPYVLRKVCVNGSIGPQLAGFGFIERPEVAQADDIEVSECFSLLGDAIEASASSVEFARQVGQMQQISKVSQNSELAVVLVSSAGESLKDLMSVANELTADNQEWTLQHVRAHIHRRKRKRKRMMEIHRRRQQSDAAARRAETLSLSQSDEMLDDDTIRQIVAQLRNEEPTLFGMMNAVTAVARETADPVLKWQLEKLGGEFLSLEADEGSPPTKKPARRSKHTTASARSKKLSKRKAVGAR